MGFPNIVNGSIPLHLENSTTKNAPFGQRMCYADGRRFAYGLCGATTLISGDLIQGKALVSGDYTDVVTDVAPAIGDTSVSLTTTTTTAANYYNDGWMHVNLATTLLEGQTYKIKETGSHAVFAAEAGHVVQLNAMDPIRVAGTTATEVGLTPNEFNGMILAPITTLTSRVIGVAQAPITNAKYGYVQTWGMSCVNSVTTSVVVGNYADAILAAAGRVGIADGASIDQSVGIFMSVPTTAGEHAAVFLIID